MEFLSEMDGDEERLKRINEAQLKPEDQMQTDEWMYELREKELQKHEMLSKEADAGGAREAEAVQDSVRLTSDAEERRHSTNRAPPIGAVDVRRSSLVDIVRTESLANMARERDTVGSTSDRPSTPPEPPPRAAQPPTNTGREPPPPDELLAQASPPGTVPQEELATEPAAAMPSGPRVPRSWDPPEQPSSPDAAASREPESPRLGEDPGGRYLVQDMEIAGGHKDLVAMNARRTKLKVGLRVSLCLTGAFSVLTAAAVIVDGLQEDFGLFAFAVCGCVVLQLGVMGIAALSRAKQDKLVNKDTELLRSFLPGDVIAQMHNGVRCIAVKHDSLTFCFCDLVGFTKATSKLPPDKLVAGLNTLITTFDNIATKMNITKVKTMGDAYMAVSGFRQSEGDHILGMALWCLKITRTLRGLEVEELNVKGVNVRMGVSTGPAVSGIIGAVKPVYDFWGDTVNMASRMESNSEKNRINCTAEVKDHLSLKHGYKFEVQNDVYIKGKGRMDTFLLVDPREVRARQKERQQTTAAWDGVKKAPTVTTFDHEIEQLASIQSEKAFHNDIRQVLVAVSALTEELELQKATALVVRTVRELLRCDRATLFMVDEEHGQLWSFHNLDTAGRRIRMPVNKGVAGWAATRGETVNISDAYEDSRFNKQVDVITGYRTRNLLCYPVRRGDHVIAVIQAVNKKHGKFNEEDTLMIALLGRQAGIHLMHGTMYEQLRQSEMRAYILFQVSRDLNTKLRPADIFESVTLGARRFMQCSRATLFIMDHGRRELYSLQTQSTGEFTTTTLPIGQGIAGHVAVVGKPTNIPDASKVPFFDPSHDLRTGYQTKSVLCVPIVDSFQQSSFETGYCLGVLEAINKHQESDITQEDQQGDPVPFSREDEEYLLSFASFVAVTIRNVMLYEQNNEQQERTQMLLRLSVVSAKAATYADLVLHLQREIPAGIDCECCQIFVQTSRKVLRVWTDEGERELVLGEGDLADSWGIVGRVVMGIVPKYSSTGMQSEGNVFRDPNCNVVIDNVPKVAAMHTCVAIPLRYDDHIVGVIQVINKNKATTHKGLVRPDGADQTRFNKQDETFLGEIARVCAVHLCCQYRVQGAELIRQSPQLAPMEDTP
eukprot:TRINITY_DN3027_c0_g1_i1.p1 TRINITY_DN3027_c0_g1~~TRINITY_DN3027_c0_g1_i1.p1  ORF type:complete len:1114 (+),score=336.58 TRINITY_DN3027_c0_g1_i1:145-3486(+)